MRGRGSMAGAAALALIGALAPALGAAQQSDDLSAESKMQLAESHVTAVLQPTDQRRLFVLDAAFPAAEAARTYILDGSTGKLQGMIPQGYWPNFAVSPDGSELYAVDSYWEKHTRGKRSDYLVVRDARTLTVSEDIPLPDGRLLIVPKKYNFDVTPDGHYGLTYNLAPQTSVWVTDLKARKPVGAIGIPGCGLIFAQAPNRFSTLCADGAVETVTFDETAHGTIQRVAGVFDARKDPAFEHSAWDKHHQMLYLVTYHGQVVPVNLSGEQAVAAPAWWLTTEAERQAGWRPGGWQVAHFHSAKQRLYVLMHRGHEWSHKEPGNEVWEFDALSGKRLRRLKLPAQAHSIAVSQDQDALLYAIGEDNCIYGLELSSGKLQYKTAPLGFTPLLLTVWGE